MRSYDIEPWIKRQWLDSEDAWKTKPRWSKNIKLDFCKEMQSMENSLNLLKEKEQQEQYYNLAVRYAQASVKGDCWWLLRESKSCYDTIRVNEADFGAKAVKLLQKAAMTSDNSLKMKALFAMGYQELYLTTSRCKLWTDDEWDEKTSEYIRKYYRQSPQFQAYKSLFEMTDGIQEEPEYISQCDEFFQFSKYYRQHKK